MPVRMARVQLFVHAITWIAMQQQAWYHSLHPTIEQEVLTAVQSRRFG